MGNLGTNYLLVGIAIATVLGVFAITNTGITSVTTTSYETMPYLLGHVVMVQTDQDGNIISYQQTDNVVTDQGFVCAMEALFDPAGVCTTQTGFFTNVTLGSDPGEAGTGDTTGDFIDASFVASAVSDDVTQLGANVTITRLFTVGDGSGLEDGDTVAETALFDTSTEGNMLARKDLSTTTVTTGDTITITWIVNGTNS